VGLGRFDLLVSGVVVAGHFRFVDVHLFSSLVARQWLLLRDL